MKCWQVDLLIQLRRSGWKYIYCIDQSSSRANPFWKVYVYKDGQGIWCSRRWSRQIKGLFMYREIITAWEDRVEIDPDERKKLTKGFLRIDDKQFLEPYELEKKRHSKKGCCGPNCPPPRCPVCDELMAIRYHETCKKVTKYWACKNSAAKKKCKGQRKHF